MRVHLKALGCRLNEAELEKWAEDFRNRGHTISADCREADLVVLNTCAVTNEAVKKSRQLIRQAQRSNPLSKLVVTGCSASLDPELDKKISAIDLLVSNHEKDRLVEIISNRLTLEATPGISTDPGEMPLFLRGRNRAFIKIQDGCRYRCTFCIVTVARGAERSRTAGEIIEQINRLHAQGVKEVVLTGVHVGGYGSDLDTNLYDLLKQILADTSIPRIRLASVEPWDLHENFFALFDNARLMPHMHLPLQSGHDQILKRMARRCNTAHYHQLVSRARGLVPDFNVTTDVIVGFPGETDEHWQQGLAYIREIGFSHIHIFPYSPRAGTAAAEMPGQIDREVRQARCRQLHRLAQELKRACLERQSGRVLPVLFESCRRDGASGAHMHSGYTPNYIRVTLPQEHGADPVSNEIIPVKITGVTPAGDALTGHIL
jgi:threonylcarbamoyladenosine tRNA methylthiotransferase MtaB